MVQTITLHEVLINDARGLTKTVDNSVVTNRPDYVRVHPPKTREVDGQDRVTAKLTVYRRLRNDQQAFVAILCRETVINGETKKMLWVIPIAGSVREEDLSFGAAYAAWARRMVDPGLEHLNAIIADRGANAKIRNSLTFAARGGSDGHAPYPERRKAWGAVLCFLSIDHDTGEELTTSVMTATAKVAMHLGWTPPEPPPTYWEGLPHGVVEISGEHPARLVAESSSVAGSEEVRP